MLATMLETSASSNNFHGVISMPIYTISSAPKFCTYLTTYFGSKLPMFYIGSGTIENIKNPTKPYRGSVSSKAYKDIWQQELKDNPHLFKTTILRTFYSRKAATYHECKLQWYFKVANSNMYINMGYAKKNFADGTKRTKEHCINLSKALTGRKSSVETKLKQSLSRKGKKKPPRTEEWKRKQRECKTGKKRSEESKLKQSLSSKGKKHRPFTEEGRLNISKSKQGVKQSEETKRKRSEMQLGKKRGPYKKRNLT